MGTYKPLHHLNSGALSARDHTDMGRWHVTSAMLPGNRTKDGEYFSEARVAEVSAPLYPVSMGRISL